MATWEYISKRRGYVLEEFVRGANTLEDALQIFRQRDVPVPQDGSLEALFATVVENKQSNKTERADTKDETAKSVPPPKKKSSPKKEKKTPKDWGIVESKQSDD